MVGVVAWMNGAGDGNAEMVLQRRLRSGSALAAALALAACGGGSGGGGGVGSTPPPPPIAPAPTPTPAPVPTPTPPPASYDTAEYRASVGPVSMNALAAYSRSATGAGVTVGVIDSGIDLQSEEFGSRIHPGSRDTAGNNTVDDEDGHGTAVAFTIAGRRNDAGTHGVAFDARLLALRADRPGSCASEEEGNDETGCRFGDAAIALALDTARTNGARVVNLSLGGDGIGSQVLAAIDRATAAGVILVFSAGNDGEAEPGSFASTPALNASIARGLIVISGSVGTTDQISSFSNRAGAARNVYLTAVGERVRAPNHENTPFLWSGTSFSAPQISGAIALIAQAFPNLSGQQIVNLLFETARDAGAVGIDEIYGRGVLDLTRAFQPVGATSLAGSREPTSLTANGTLSAPMGDATSGAGVGAVILDRYDRAFGIDLARTLRRDGPVRNLAGALRMNRRNMVAGMPGASIAVTIAPGRTLTAGERMAIGSEDAEGARAIAASVAGQLGSDVRFAIGASESGAGLVARVAGRSDPAFLVAGDVTRAAGFDSDVDASVAVRHQFGGFGLTVAGESGDVLTRGEALLPALRGRYDRYGYDRVMVGIDRRFGPVSANLLATRLVEHDTMLGAHFSGALGAARATSHFVDLAIDAELGGGWALGLATRQGWTTARLRGGLEGAGALRTTAWSFDVSRDDWLTAGDRWGVRVAQPLRVAAGGGIDLRLPTNFDYDTMAVDAWTVQRLNLSPTGRAIDWEMRYARPIGAGWMSTHLFYRRDPGNFADLPDDRGAAVRFSTNF